MPNPIVELLFGAIPDLVCWLFQQRPGRRASRRALRSATSGCPSQLDVFAQTVRRLIAQPCDYADFKVEGAETPWVQVAYNSGEYAVNFHYPNDSEDLPRALRERGVELPPGRVEYVKPRVAATYMIGAPAEQEVVSLVNALFARFLGLGDAYVVTGTIVP